MATAVITPLSRKKVREICRRDSLGTPGGIGESIRGNFSSGLDGQVLELLLDGPGKLRYEFLPGGRLRWSGARRSGEEAAQILSLSSRPGLYLINHLRLETFPLENITLILDLETDLCTLILARLGGALRPRDVERTIHFGCILRNGHITEKRHGYSDELVRRIVDWHYDRRNEFTVKHLYISPEHMVYYLFRSPGPDRGLVETAECAYVKVREGVYIMSWLEKGHQGMQGVALMDMETMTDVGSFFGISIKDTLDNYTFAAFGEDSTL